MPQLFVHSFFRSHVVHKVNATSQRPRLYAMHAGWCRRLLLYSVAVPLLLIDRPSSRACVSISSADPETRTGSIFKNDFAILDFHVEETTSVFCTSLSLFCLKKCNSLWCVRLHLSTIECFLFLWRKHRKSGIRDESLLYPMGRRRRRLDIYYTVL